jgi:hypothetical protein
MRGAHVVIRHHRQDPDTSDEIEFDESLLQGSLYVGKP